MTEDAGEAEVWRVVVDPNVLVSPAIAAGNPQLVLELAAVGAIRVLACPLLPDELEKVLSRDRFLRWRTREQLDRFLTDVRALAQVVDDPTDVPSATRDPGDDYLVALARATGASAICSGDDDLFDVEDLLALRPGETVRRVLRSS